MPPLILSHHRIRLCLFSLHQSFQSGKCRLYRFKAETDRGWFELNPAFNYSGNHGQRSDRQEIRLPGIDQFAAEMDDFARCILENRPAKVPGEEGLRDVKIMMAIYESARTGKAVRLA